jgi:hypothetical protein
VSYAESDDAEGRIDVFDDEGKFITEVAAHSAKSIAIDSKGNLYVFRDSGPPWWSIRDRNPLLGRLAVDRSNDHLVLAQAGQLTIFDSAENSNAIISGPVLVGTYVESLALDTARNRIYITTCKKTPRPNAVSRYWEAPPLFRSWKNCMGPTPRPVNSPRSTARWVLRLTRKPAASSSPISVRLRLFFSSPRTTNTSRSWAVLTQAPGQANTAAATVLLPKGQFIDQSHINNPCTRVQFNADACPIGSILGAVEARTPLLDEPLRGNVYFRSNGGEREPPDIVADLRGPFRVTLVGFVDSVKGRVRTRSLSVPDAPVSRFTMNLFPGKRGLIENSENLCKSKNRATIRLIGQNGARHTSDQKVGTRCKRTSKQRRR